MDQKPLAQPKARKHGHFEGNRGFKVNRKFTQKPMFNPKLAIVFSRARAVRRGPEDARHDDEE